jgi:hypothetical protein
MLNDPQTARFVTRNYHALQGLVRVPLGAFLLIFGVGQLLGVPGFQQGDCTLPSIALPVVIVLTLVARHYYHRRFGEVQRETSNRELWLVLSSVAGWFFLTMLDMTWLGGIPVSFTMVGFALFFAMIPITSEGKRRHYFPLVTLLVVIAFMPAFGLLNKMDFFSGRWHGNLVIGAVLVIGGLLDHRMLVHLLNPSQKEPS